MIYRLLALLLARPRVAAWLIARSQRTPYSPIHGPDGSLYMDRWWLFNPYPAPGDYSRRGWRDWLPSIRVHHILRPDSDRHLHDHPWDARTFILKGWYTERRLGTGLIARYAGSTARIDHNEYHAIKTVSDGGAYTLFVTGKYRGTWGFLVDGRKVKYRDYLK